MLCKLFPFSVRSILVLHQCYLCGYKTSEWRSTKTILFLVVFHLQIICFSVTIQWKLKKALLYKFPAKLFFLSHPINLSCFWPQYSYNIVTFIIHEFIINVWTYNAVTLDLTRSFCHPLHLYSSSASVSHCICFFYLTLRTFNCSGCQYPFSKSLREISMVYYSYLTKFNFWLVGHVLEVVTRIILSKNK